MRGVRMLGAVAATVVVSFAVIGCGGSTTGPAAKGAFDPDSTKADTAFYSYGGQRYATFDGYWYLWSSGVGYRTSAPIWIPCLNYIGIDCIDDADATVSRARALIEEAGGVIQAIARRPEYPGEYATIFVVLPDPPRTPTAEEMRALYGEARVIPAVENFFHVQLRSNVHLLDWLKAIDDHPELFTDGGFGSGAEDHTNGP